MEEIQPYINRIAEEAEGLLESWLPVDKQLKTKAEQRLRRAMRAAVLGGGKRLRAALVVIAGDLFGLPRPIGVEIGGAIELIHAYSLVHDDLPAMDDSAVRRGQPSIHKAYDEVTAILVGDGLQALAFERLSLIEGLAAIARLDLVCLLARAAGERGMVGGQMVDMAQPEGPEDLSPDEAAIRHLQALKTGALIEVSLIMGARAGGATPEQLQALSAFGHDIGFAYQIVDDLLDHRGDAEALGKPVGQDRANEKPTYVEMFGEEMARQRVHMLHQQACAHLSLFGESGDRLKQLAGLFIQRSF